MSLSDEEKAAVRAEVDLMIAEYRAKPTQELEDGLGMRIAVLPPEQREYVPSVLLEIVAAERQPG
jgi:hypothetical protein